MSTREEIILKLKGAEAELAARFGVVHMAIFGSAARGEAKAGSDVDVLVTFDPSAKVTLFTLARLQRRLEELLGRKVDVVEDHPGLRSAFRSAIQRDLRHVA